MATILSMDLRTRLVSAMQADWSCRAAAERFGISSSSAVKLLARVRAGQVRRRPADAVGRLAGASSRRSRPR